MRTRVKGKNAELVAHFNTMQHIVAVPAHGDGRMRHVRDNADAGLPCRECGLRLPAECFSDHCGSRRVCDACVDGHKPRLCTGRGDV